MFSCLLPVLNGTKNALRLYRVRLFKTCIIIYGEQPTHREGKGHVKFLT